MKRKLCACFAVLAFVGGLAMPAGAKDRLAIGYTAITGIKAGLWVAEEAKLFDKYNIETHVILITSGSKMVQAMLGGDLPLAGAAGNAAVDANLAGSDIVMFGALAKVPAFYIMALPEIKTIEDLRGKAVGVTRFGSSTDFTMRYLLRKHGMNPDRDVTIHSSRRYVCRGDDAQDQGDRRRAIFQPSEFARRGGRGALARQHGHGRSLFPP